MATTEGALHTEESLAVSPAPITLDGPVEIDLTDDVRSSRLGSDYLKLWTASAVSNIGDGVRLTALPLLAATLTKNPLYVSGILFAGKLPWLLLTLHSGAIADRTDRRRLIVIMNVARFIVMGMLGLSVLAGMNGLVLLYVVAFLQGVGEVFSDNAAFALLPSIVPKARLEEANGRLEAAILTMNEFAGPALGGLLFAVAVGTPFLFDSATFLVAGYLVFRIGYRSPPPPAGGHPTKIRHDIAEGLKWLGNHRLLRNLSFIAAVTNMMLFATFGIMVLFALEVLDLNSVGFGMLLSVEAFGALGGSLLAARLSRRLGVTRSVFGALLVAGVSNFVIGFSTAWPVVALMMVSIAFAGGMWNVVTNSLRQRLVPDRLLGRVQSTHRLLSWGAIPVGTLLGGLLSRSFGLQAPFLIAGIVLALLAFTAAATLSRASRSEVPLPL